MKFLDFLETLLRAGSRPRYFVRRLRAQPQNKKRIINKYRKGDKYKKKIWKK